jgi:hypothetical protein
VRVRLSGTGWALLLVLASLVCGVTRAEAADDVVRVEGRVTAVRPGAVTLSLGATDGLRAGDEGTIATEDTPANGSRRKVNVARIKVTAVRADGADATVTASAGTVRVGQQATFLYRGRAQACLGALRVTTTPAGAKVSVDGTAVDGPSPVVVHGVPCGDREVVLRLLDHEDARRTVTVTRGRIEPVTVDLVPTGTVTPCVGQVFVVTEPAGALVLVDDQPVKGVTPLKQVLGCGSHLITVSLSGHDARQPVKVERGGREWVELTLPEVAAPVVNESDGVATAAPAPARALPPAPPAAGETAMAPTAVPAPAPAPVAAVTVPPTPAPPPPAAVAPADVVVSAFGYEGVGGLQGVLSLGLLVSEYAIEIDDHLVLGWKIRSGEATVPLAPGRHRLRVLVRNFAARAPIALHEGFIDVKPGVRNEAHMNFLISAITVNGDRSAFNRLQGR